MYVVKIKIRNTKYDIRNTGIDEPVAETASPHHESALSSPRLRGPIQYFDSTDSEARSEGSDNEVREFLDLESDSGGQSNILL